MPVFYLCCNFLKTCGIILESFKGIIMAFTPGNTTHQEPSKTKPVLPPSILDTSLTATATVDDDEEIDFLSPRKDIKKDTRNDVYLEETLKKTSYQITLKTLNSLKIVSPIVSTIIQMSNKLDDAEITALFKSMVLEISESAVKACESIGVDPKKEKNAWVRNVFERSIADFTKTQYLTHGNVDTSKLQQIIAQLSEFSEHVAEKEPFEEISAESLVSLATIKAMLPIVNESMNNFDFHRNLESSLEDIMMLIAKECEKGTKILASDYADEKSRAQLYYLLMQEAGVLYASCWRSEAKRVFNILENNPTERVIQSFEKFKNNGGFPLTKIEQDFVLFFQRFIEISKKLSVAERKANLATRIKKK